MGHRILVLEDDAAVAKLVAEALAPLGVDAVVAANGKLGKEEQGKGAFALAVVDLMLPGVDGFKVAKELRATQPSLPFVFVSGVYKNQQAIKDAQTQFGAPLLIKPFDVDDLRQRVAQALGVHWSDPKKAAVIEAPRRAASSIAASTFGAQQGDLALRPLQEVLGDAYRGKAIGSFDIVRERVRRKIWMQRGFVLFAASNVRAENAGGMQVAQGQLTEAALQTAVDNARQTQRALHDALVGTGAMTPAQVQVALKRQTEEVVLAALGMPEGTWTFAPLKEPLGVPEARVHPLTLVLTAVQRHYPAESIRAFLQERASQLLHRSPELERDLYTIKQSFPGETVTPLVNGRSSVGDALGKVKESELALLFGLIGFGLAGFEKFADKASTGPQAVVAPQPPPSTPRASPPVAQAAPRSAPQLGRAPTKAASPEVEAARESVRQEWRRIANADLYTVLGIDRKAPADAVRKGFLLAARRWHTDAFAAVDLGEERRTVEQIFAKVNEANETLGSAQKRGDYDVLIDRQEKGLPTDVAAILQAEEIFHKAVALYRQNRFADAESQLRQAVKLNHAEAEFWAVLGGCIAKTRAAAGEAEARACFAKAKELMPDFVETYYYEGLLEIVVGNVDAAEKAFKKVLVEKSSHPDASRELRAIRDKREKDAKGGGLFGKILKGK